MPDIDSALAAGLRREQVMLLCRVMSRAPLVNLVTVAFFCAIVWEFVPAWTVFAWAGIVLASEFVRFAYARRLLAAPPADAGRALQNLVWIALFVGCARGSAMPLFFASLPPLAHAALSVIFLGFCAGGLSTHGAHARAFYAFAGPMLLAMGLAWLGTGTREGVLLAVLFALFAFIIFVGAQGIEKLVRDSFVIRHQRDQLVEQLDRERQQVALARDGAEHANNAKSRFLAAASHDLRQPLHALSLFSATLSMRAETPGLREISDNIGSALRSLSALVDALLDISKLDARAVSPELQPVEIRRVLERVAAEFRPAAVRKGIELRTVSCDAVAHTDPVLLERVLRNLVDNAVKYTSRGHIAIETCVEDGKLRVAVEDSGEGIVPEERERIFEEFYQIGNPERDRTLGLGLGLAIVRRMGRLLGTEVELVSELGRGSTFTIRLPLSSAAPRSEGHASAAVRRADPLRGRGVLVIDDEPDVRVGMRRLLEAWGCRVFVCSGLADANRLLDEYSPRIDVVVADFRLRAGESGIATIAELRRRLGQLPAMLVTGDTAPERIREAEASGLPMLHKPVSADALQQALVVQLTA